MTRRILIAAIGWWLPLVAFAAELRTGQRMEWAIDGVQREAEVFLVKSETPAPLVFAFHGHGGSMRNAARSFRMHEVWPEAIVVYMQGLNTPGRLTDPEGKRPGWQSAQGEQEDRDLKFFDAVLKTLQEKHKVDAARIYSTGHSNGGGFTYLLWSERPDVFAAFAPSAAVGNRQLKPLQPKPVMHIAGEKDTLVKFSWQELMISRLKRLNDCGTGSEWAKHCTLYESKSGHPVLTMIHPGDHKYPDEAPPLIAKFFQSQRR